MVLAACVHSASAQEASEPIYYLEMEGSWFAAENGELSDNMLGEIRPRNGDFTLDMMLVKVRVDAAGLKQPANVRLVAHSIGYLGQGELKTVFDASERLPRVIGSKYDYGYVAFWLDDISCQYLRLRAELTVDHRVVATSQKDVELECWE